MSTSQPDSHQLQLTAALVVEDHGTEFYLVSRGDGHDYTLSLDAEIAARLAQFILERRGHDFAAPIPAIGRQDQREDQDSDR